MLKHRVIPVLLYDGSYCVQTVRYQSVRRLGPMEQYVNNMADRNIDELVILDITASKESRGPRFSKIKEFTEGQFCPVSYGGGIYSLADVNALIKECGVDKVIIKTASGLISEAAKKFGSQAIVYSMDCYVHHSNGTYFVHGMPKSMGVTEWAKIIEEKGAGEILLTAMYKNGTYDGYNFDLISRVSSAVNIPVIANGGCGSPEDMVKAIQAGASAVAASSMFALRGVTPQDCARAIQAAGLPARVAEQPPE